MVLTASVRKIDHLLYAPQARFGYYYRAISDFKRMGPERTSYPREWDYVYHSEGLKNIPFKEIDLTKNWRDYDIRHELTDKGMERFSADWNALIK